MTGPLKISGNILSSEFAADNWSFINHYMSGGWARGIVNVKDNSNALQMQIGVHGSGQTLSRMYFGKAYNDFAMEIFPATKRTNFIGTLTKEGKPIATEEYVDANAGGGGTTIVTSATEPDLSTGDEWHREI